MNHSFSCSNFWSSWGLVSIPLLCQEQALPVLLVGVTGGAKHQGSGNVGEGAVRGQVLASSAFLCPALPMEIVNCFVFFPSFTVSGAFWIMAKMVRRTCAFCSEGEASSVMYIATERDIAAHQDCLLFSSGFVESEDHNPENQGIRFDVASVLKELRRGKKLVCNFCRKKGATVGCEERACRRSYHFFCALCDDAAVETDQVNGVYRYRVLLTDTASTWGVSARGTSLHAV